MKLLKLKISTLFTLINTWIKKVKDRDALRNMSDHMLKDIGMTRFEIMRDGHA